MRAKGILLSIFSFLLSTTVLAAEDHEYKWSVSASLGLNKPLLNELNHGAFLGPYEGPGSILDSLGATQSVEYSYPSPLPPLAPGSLGRLEFQWHFNPRHALIMGTGTWDSSSSVSTIGRFPIQGGFQDVSAQRTADISYLEYYLGWRYNIRSKPNTYNLYLTTSLHQRYNIEYRETMSWLFLSGPPASFRKTMVTTANTTGLPLLEGTAGGEWFLTKWLAIGLEGGYDLGLIKPTLRNTKQTTDLLDTDNVTINGPPDGPDPGSGNKIMIYKSVGGGDYKPLRLNFDGWLVLMKATIYY